MSIIINIGNHQSYPKIQSNHNQEPEQGEETTIWKGTPMDKDKDTISSDYLITYYPPKGRNSTRRISNLSSESVGLPSPSRSCRSLAGRSASSCAPFSV